MINPNEPRISQYLYAKAIKANIPLSGNFELSPCCNLQCRMCYVRKTPQQVQDLGGLIPADRWLDMAKSCKQAGMLFLLLTGGEPFIYPDFKRLYLELHKLGFMLIINTNGTLIGDGEIEWLKKNPPYRMNITLYGASEQTYQRLCADSQAFYRVCHAAEKLHDAGISVKFNASITPYNITDLDEMYQIAEGIGLHMQASAYMFPPIRRDETMYGKGFRLNPADAGDCQMRIDRRRLTAENYNKRIAAIYNRVRLGPDDGDCERDTLEPLRCRAGRCTFWLNWKGEMTPCGMFSSGAAYPFRDGFEAAWKQTVEYTKTVTMPKKCTDCPDREVCNVCGAMVYTETGGFDRQPEYLCEMTRRIIADAKSEFERDHARSGGEHPVPDGDGTK